MLFLTITATAMDSDTAINTVRITSRVGNSGLVGVGESVFAVVAVGIAVGEAVGAWVGAAVGAVVGAIVRVLVGVGVGAGLGVMVGVDVGEAEEALKA